MRVLIFGAAGGTGRHLVSQGLRQGHHVTAFVRNPATFTAEHPRLTIAKGDISDRNSFDHVLSGVNVVICVLANKTGKALFNPVNAISQGLPNIISAMQDGGIERLLFVSSFGLNDKKFFLERILLRTLLRNLFIDLPVQEETIKQSRLNWTIIRPARLTNGPKTGTCRSGDLYIHPFSESHGQMWLTFS